MANESSTRQRLPDLRLLHYNDVYHIESGSAEPVGGIARFQSVVNEYRSDMRYADQPSLLTFFSGDAFNPSLESSVTKGRHMVPFLNAIGTNVACVGNHDLDFGIAQFMHLRSQCNFPWLLANVLDPALGENVPLAHCEKTKILISSNGIKIGVIGLGEREWLETINVLPPNLIYRSASATAEELVPGLRSQGCELIIALTHMREPNDIKLAQKTSDGLIDLILGGHDHFYNHEIVKSTHVLRSGTDFRNLSYIESWRTSRPGRPSQVDSKATTAWDLSITRRDIVREVPEDPKCLKLVDQLTISLRDKLNKPIGYTAAPLDARFTTVRLRESNWGNFVCDLMRHYYATDCALIAAGTIRGDQIYPPGVLRMKDIMNCFPFEDPVVVLRVTGQALLDALENSVSLFPALEGRFPQISNMAFEFNGERPAGARVLWVKVGQLPLEKARAYTLATRGYMAHGKDGFTSLVSQSEGGDAEEIVSEEDGILLSTLLRQYFLSLKVVGRWRRWTSFHKHWDGVHAKLHQQHAIKLSDHPTYLRGARQGLQANGHKIPAIGRRDTPSDPNQDPQQQLPTSTSSLTTTTETAIPVQRHPPLALPHRAKIMASRKSIDEAQGQEMVDSDSDSSIILLDDEPNISSHPLLSSATSSSVEQISHDHSDYLYYIARTYSKRWMELAGVKREGVGMVDEHDQTEIPSWTRGIAPRLENRISQYVNKVEN